MLTYRMNDFGAFKDRVTGVKLMISWTDGNTYVLNKDITENMSVFFG